MSTTLEIKNPVINNIISGKESKKEILKHQKDSEDKKTQPDIVAKDGTVIEVKSRFASSKKEKVLECGPLESRFPCSESKILDFLIAFQEYDYSISDISKNSGVGFKTTLGVIKDLESRLIILKERNVGRAKMFKINLESPEAIIVNKLALEIATKRAIEQASQTE